MQTTLGTESLLFGFKIYAFVVCFQEGIIPLVSISGILKIITV